MVRLELNGAAAVPESEPHNGVCDTDEDQQQGRCPGSVKDPCIAATQLHLIHCEDGRGNEDDRSDPDHQYPGLEDSEPGVDSSSRLDDSRDGQDARDHKATYGECPQDPTENQGAC